MKSDIKRIRANDCISTITRHGTATFITLTTADVCDYRQIADRWREVRHFLRREGGVENYVQNFEIHPWGHGWHIHAVIDRLFPAEKIDRIKAMGFGRINFKRVTTVGVATYLTKHCFKALRGQSASALRGRKRLVNVSRGLPSLSSYSWQGDGLARRRKLFREIRQHIESVNGYPVNRLSLLKLVDFGVGNGLTDQQISSCVYWTPHGIKYDYFRALYCIEKNFNLPPCARQMDLL